MISSLQELETVPTALCVDALCAVRPRTANDPASIPFDAIAAPGAYVCNWNGYLLRVPPGALGPGSGRTINLVGAEPLFVTKISDDPEIPVTHARSTATGFHLRVSF